LTLAFFLCRLIEDYKDYGEYEVCILSFRHDGMTEVRRRDVSMVPNVVFGLRACACGSECFHLSLKFLLSLPSHAHTHDFSSYVSPIANMKEGLMTQHYTFCVAGSHRFENVDGETRKKALEDAAFLLNANESDLVELPPLLPIGQCYLDQDGKTVDTVKR
jgi:hypothetical protein